MRKVRLFSTFPILTGHPGDRKLLLLMGAICTKSCSVCEETEKTPWGTLPDQEFARLDAAKETLQFARNEFIFEIGQPATSVYCVGSGRVQLFRTAGSREQTFLIGGPGTWIGYRDAAAGLALRHSARCLTDVVVCALPADIVRDFADRFPVFSGAVLGNLARGWVESEEQSFNLGVRKTREKLADYLLHLQNGTKGDLASSFELPLTREVLATIIGTTTESVVRALSDFKARGWITTTRGKVRILNRPELQRLVAEA